MLPPQQAGFLYVAQSMANGDPAHTEHLAQFCLVGQLRAVRPGAVGDGGAQGLFGLVPQRLRSTAIKKRNIGRPDHAVISVQSE